jgi:hypothetical protein
MKINNLSKKIAITLNIVVYFALILTMVKPLLTNVDPDELKVLLASSLFMVVSCLIMTILTILSKTKVNSLIAGVTLIVLVIIKLVLLH